MCCVKTHTRTHTPNKTNCSNSDSLRNNNTCQLQVNKSNLTNLYGNN